jgi:hypothetical protein
VPLVGPTGDDGIWNEQFYVSVIYPLKKRKKVVKNLEKISQEKNRLKFY